LLDNVGFSGIRLCVVDDKKSMPSCSQSCFVFRPSSPFDFPLLSEFRPPKWFLFIFPCSFSEFHPSQNVSHAVAKVANRCSQRLTKQLEDLEIPFVDDFSKAMNSTDHVVDAIFGWCLLLREATKDGLL
jgi:hypothetical protein